jgi:hypothetical protein
VGTNVSKEHVGCMFRVEKFTVKVYERGPSE